MTGCSGNEFQPFFGDGWGHEQDPSRNQHRWMPGLSGTAEWVQGLAAKIGDKYAFVLSGDLQNEDLKNKRILIERLPNVWVFFVFCFSRQVSANFAAVLPKRRQSSSAHTAQFP